MKNLFKKLILIAVPLLTIGCTAPAISSVNDSKADVSSVVDDSKASSKEEEKSSKRTNKPLTHLVNGKPLI